MALDVIEFPDPIGSMIGLLGERWPGLPVANLPDSYSRSLLVRGTTSPATMVSQSTLYAIECRDRKSPMAASTLANQVASYLDACARGLPEPLGCELHSIVHSYPDPDDGCPRAVVTCSLSWGRI